MYIYFKFESLRGKKRINRQLLNKGRNIVFIWRKHHCWIKVLFQWSFKATSTVSFICILTPFSILSKYPGKQTDYHDFRGYVCFRFSSVMCFDHTSRLPLQTFHHPHRRITDSRQSSRRKNSHWDDVIRVPHIVFSQHICAISFTKTITEKWRGFTVMDAESDRFCDL